MSYQQNILKFNKIFTIGMPKSKNNKKLFLFILEKAKPIRSADKAKQSRLHNVHPVSNYCYYLFISFINFTYLPFSFLLLIILKCSVTSIAFAISIMLRCTDSLLTRPRIITRDLCRGSMLSPPSPLSAPPSGGFVNAHRWSFVKYYLSSVRANDKQNKHTLASKF